MDFLKRTFRLWWQVPRSVHNRLENRKVSFLELFYDLVYVVVISALTHALAEDITVTAFIQFLFLFMFVWWTWINGTFYHELHGNNDIRTRVFTFLQMLVVASMAVFAHDAFGEQADNFTIACITLQVIFLFLWWRTGVHDEEHRVLSRPYMVSTFLNIILFAISLFLESPLRYYVWIAAILLYMIMPILVAGISRYNKGMQAQREVVYSPSESVVERFGLFTIIVLGEVIVGVVNGIASHHAWTMYIGIVGGIGMLIAIGLWWLYFDFVSSRLPKKQFFLIWVYTHLIVTGGIAIIGALILYIMKHPQDDLPNFVRMLLSSAIAVTLMGIFILMGTVQSPVKCARFRVVGQYVIACITVVIVMLGFFTVPSLLLLIVIDILLLFPIVFGVLFWVRNMEEMNMIQAPA